MRLLRAKTILAAHPAGSHKAMQLIPLERITKLGHLGEDFAAERLRQHGFTDVENLNLRRNNYPFGDLLATKDGQCYFIGVKARNEMRQGDVGLNESYNLVLISDPVNRKLKEQGKTRDQITAMLLAEVEQLAAAFDATPAWVTVPIRPREGTFSAYFGPVAQLGNRRSVPMTPKACAGYLCLARDISDPRVTDDFAQRVALARPGGADEAVSVMAAMPNKAAIPCVDIVVSEARAVLRGDQWRMSRSFRLSRTCANRGTGARPLPRMCGSGVSVARGCAAS
jgi:hypothetical protein